MFRQFIINMRMSIRLVSLICIIFGLIFVNVVVDSKDKYDSTVQMASFTTTTPVSSMPNEDAKESVQSSMLQVSTELAKNNDEDDEDDYHDDTVAKPKAIRLPATDMKQPKMEDDDEVDEEEEEDEDGDEGCDGRLSTFVRSFDGSALLPDDYQELADFMHTQSVYGNVHHINDTLAILDRSSKIMDKLRNNKDIADAGMYISSVLMDKMYEARVSTECLGDFAAMGNAIRNMEPWAFKFPDSFGSLFLAGMLHGQFSSFGEFDQCVRIKSPQQENGRHIYGQYCSLHFSAITPPIETYDPSWEEQFRAHPYFDSIIMETVKKFNMDKYIHQDFALFITQATDRVNDNIYHNGICIPHTCTGEDVQKMINEIIYPLTKMSVRIDDNLCDTHSDLKVIQLDNYQWTSIIVLSAITIIVTFCTMIHLFIKQSENSQLNQSTVDNNNHNDNLKIEFKQMNQSNEKLTVKRRPIYQQMIVSFSIVENTEKLMTYSANRIPILDVLRALFSLLIFPVNSLGLPLLFYPEMYRNSDGMTRQEMLHSNGHWTVQIPGMWFDGFVFVFGVLIVLQQFKWLKRSLGEFSYFQYIFKRWFRLSIAMAGTILVIYLYPLSGNGPMWFYNEQYYVAPCKSVSSLVSSFLYYSNWNDALDSYTTRATMPICNPPTWFTSSFVQLYLFAPLVFVPLFHWPTFGIFVTLITILLSPLLAIAPRLLTCFPSYIETTAFTTFASNAQAITHSHMNPLLYVTSLSVGMFTGYLIKCRPNSAKFGGRVLQWILWFVSAASVVFIFVWHNTFKVQNVIHPVDSIVGWFAYYKLVWSLFLGYTTYLCATGGLRPLNDLLSIRRVQPIAKLSYCIYLLRSVVVMHRQTSVRHTNEMHYYDSFQNISLDFLLTVGLAYILHLLFEAPIIRLIELIENPTSAELYQTFDPSIGSIDKIASLSSTSSSLDPEYAEVSKPQVIQIDAKLI